MRAASSIDGQVKAAAAAQWRPASRRAVLRALWSTNLAEELQYRGNFVASVLGTIFWLAMALLTLALFFRQTERLGGWDFWEVVVLLGVFNTLAGIVDALLRPGIGSLAEQVRSGALDLVLSRPVEPQFFVSFRRLAIWRLADVVVGLALIGYALGRLAAPPTALQLATFAVAMLAAIAVVYALWVALMSLAFWFVKVENLSVIFDAVFSAARYPVSAYPGALRFVFVYLLPIAWTTTIPASALTGRLNPAGAVVAATVGAAALLVSRLLWKTALRHYTSAGG
jgi:ABC-2 type transport system permease protein